MNSFKKRFHHKYTIFIYSIIYFQSAIFAGYFSTDGYHIFLWPVLHVNKLIIFLWCGRCLLYFVSFPYIIYFIQIMDHLILSLSHLKI